MCKTSYVSSELEPVFKCKLNACDILPSLNLIWLRKSWKDRGMINDSLKPEPDYKREGCQQCNKSCGIGAWILASCFFELGALNNDYSASVYVRFKAVPCLLFQHFGFWGPYCSTSNSKLGLWYIPRCYYWGSGPFLGHTVCESSVSIKTTGINIRLQYIE